MHSDSNGTQLLAPFTVGAPLTHQAATELIGAVTDRPIDATISEGCDQRIARQQAKADNYR